MQQRITAQSRVSLRGYPAVFVMNPYYSGIGIARALHGHDIDVFALSSERNTPGGRSRFFAGIYDVPNGRDEPEALYRRLLEIRDHQTDAPVIFPTRDLDVLFLQQYRDQLSPFYRLPRSLDRTLARILDKLELAEVASQQQIDVPKTVCCASETDIEKVPTILKFPLVIKPRYSYQWRQGGADKIIGAKKAVILESAAQLRQEYGRVAGATAEVLLQEYVPGGDADIVVCCCYVDRNGELAGYFTAKKRYQYPPLVGTGCVVELANIPQIVAPSRRLVQTFGYTGLAEIEFKYDRRTDRFCLIEVNPRHWDQHELGTLAGVNVTWLAYRDLIERPVLGQTPTYPSGVTCSWIAEREALLLMMRSGYRDVVKVASRRIASFRRRSTVFAILNVRDPLPGLQLCFRLLAEFAKRAWRRFWHSAQTIRPLRRLGDVVSEPLER